MSRIARRGWATVGTLAALFAIFLAVMHFRGRPQDLPWTPLDLADPPGWFTATKLAALSDDFRQCRTLLARVGVRFTLLPPVTQGQCGYADAVRLSPGGARRIGFDPASPGMACPVAAALTLWEWHVVQPAARRHFGRGVARFEHFGTYACRAIAGSDTASQHSFARAIDIGGFVLDDGTRITVARDWAGDAPKAAFLREVRDGACRLFATTLSPDYNAAHRDHLHFDEAPGRGMRGFCR